MMRDKSRTQVAHHRERESPHFLLLSLIRVVSITAACLHHQVFFFTLILSLSPSLLYMSACARLSQSVCRRVHQGSETRTGTEYQETEQGKDTVLSSL